MLDIKQFNTGLQNEMLDCLTCYEFITITKDVETGEVDYQTCAAVQTGSTIEVLGTLTAKDVFKNYDEWLKAFTTFNPSMVNRADSYIPKGIVKQ